MLVDSTQARSTVGRLQRARNTLAELIARSAPKSTIALARLNYAKLKATEVLLPRSRAA